MATWRVKGLSYWSAQSEAWSTASVSFKAVRWTEREHPRDRRGRFARKPGGGGPAGSTDARAPSPEAAVVPPHRPGTRQRMTKTEVTREFAGWLRTRLRSRHKIDPERATNSEIFDAWEEERRDAEPGTYAQAIIEAVEAYEENTPIDKPGYYLSVMRAVRGGPAPKPGPKPKPAPEPSGPGPADKLGREIHPGAKVMNNGLFGTAVRVSGNRVQVQWDRNGKKSTYDAGALTVMRMPDGSQPGGDGLPAVVPARDLRFGDRVYESARTGYIVNGPVSPSPNYPELYRIPVVDLDGNENELVRDANEPTIVYPPGMAMPGEKLRKKNASESPSSLQKGETFRFGMPGMDGPVYMVESVSEPREVTNRWIDDRGQERSRTFKAVDLVMLTADGEKVSGTFEDSSGARIVHSPQVTDNPPQIPAKVIKVGDVLADPEDRGNGNLTVTAITGEPQMSTSQMGWSMVTHDRLLTLRDERGNVRKIYNRTEWSGVQRISKATAKLEPSPAPTSAPTPDPAPTPEPPSTPAPAPEPKAYPNETTSKPLLHATDREAIIAMGFEGDSGQSENVKAAVAAVRNRDPLTLGQLNELADQVRSWTARQKGLSAADRRTNERIAHWLDAAAAEIQGVRPPELPGRTGVEKTTASKLTAGDTVALVGARGEVDVVTVRGAQPLYRRLAVLQLEHPDGREETRTVIGTSAAYLLPDVPAPTPEPPTGSARREHIHPAELRPGDIADLDGKRYRVEAVVQKSAWAWDVSYQAIDRDAEPQQLTTGYRTGFGYPAAIRVQRGPGSEKQPWTGLMPPEKPTPVSAKQVKLGDRIAVEVPSGVRRGTVIKLEKTRGTNSDETTIVATIVTDEGDRRSTVLSGNNRTITRLIQAEGNGLAQVEEIEARASRNNHIQELAQALTNHRQAARTYIAGVADRSVSASRVANELREMADQRQGLSFVNRGGVDLIAWNVARELNPEMRKRLADELRPALDEMALREFRALADALDANRPLPGEDEEQAARRLIRAALDVPVQTDNQQAARVLADLSPALRGEIQPTPDDAGLPDIPTGGDLAARVAAYREFIGGSGSTFGKHRVTRSIPRKPTLEDLEAGVAPEMDTVTDWVPEPRAADGGPGPATMRQLAAVHAAGNELSRLLEKQVGEPFRRREQKLDEEMESLNAEVSELMSNEWISVRSLQDQYAREHGYRDWNSLMRAEYEAETFEERDRLQMLMDKIGNRANAEGSTKKRQDESRAKYQRLANEKADLAAKRKSLQRKAILDLVSEARGEPMGDDDMDFDFVGPEPGDTPGRIMRITDVDREALSMAMGFAVDSYPESWLATIKNKYKIKKSGRGFHRNDGTVIALSPDVSSIPGAGPYGATAVHELGHGMELRIEGLSAAENAFLWHRTATGKIGSRKRPQPTTIYAGTREVGWKDDFKEHYTGRSYGGEKAFEVFTTGYEDLVGGGSGDYVDDEFRDWVLGVMVLL